MVQRVAEHAPDDFPIRSTRRQLLRYCRWWTKQNRFFRGRSSDLASDAEALLREIA